MIDKEQLLDSMRHEVGVIRHLATKVPPGTLDWRPTPGQRSTLELLRYLTTCGTIGVSYAVTGSWARAEEIEAEAEAVTPETFAAAMDRQMAELERLIRPLAEEDLRTRVVAMPWGTPTKLGLGLVDMGLKPLTAYRMQLFLYAKQSGNAALGPSDCWAGVARPAAPASPA